MNIGLEIIRQEAVERAMKRYRSRSHPTQLAEVEQQIAEIKAQLDLTDDDPSLWPLRKRLVSLHHMRQELLAQ